METSTWIELYVPDQGLVLQEPAVIAFDEKGRIAAIGNDVQEKVLFNVSVWNPFCEGRIKMTKEDFEAAAKILNWFVTQTYKKYCKKRLFHKFEIAVCMMPEVAKAEQAAMEDVLYRIGAGKVILTEQPVEEFMKISTKKDWDLLLQIKENP